MTLFRLIALGDECAFEQVFELYKSRLVSYLTVFTKSTEEAKKLTQEIFLKVWMSRQKLTDVESPQNYLFVMAKNKALGTPARKLGGDYPASDHHDPLYRDAELLLIAAEVIGESAEATEEAIGYVTTMHNYCEDNGPCSNILSISEVI